MISRLIKKQKAQLSENWPRMVRDAGEAHGLHQWQLLLAKSADSPPGLLERQIVASAVTHKLETHKNHIIDVDLPASRPDLDRTDMVTLKIGTYETIDLALHEFQQLESCLHHARMTIEAPERAL